DRVNTTAKVFLGITLGCAQCHDHKYDPFSQREYYQFFAFFNSDSEVDIPAPLAKEDPALQQKKAEFDKKLAEVQNALNAYRKKEFPVNLKKWEETLKPEELKKLPTNIQTVLKLADAKRTPAQKKELTAFFGKQDKQLAQLTAKVAELQKQAPKITMAQTLALGSLRKTHVMRRGDFLRPGVQVDPGT